MMILAGVFQVAVLVCVLIHIGKKEVARQVALAPGQTYEYVHVRTSGGPSAVFYYTVLDVKSGFVKYHLQGVEIQETKAECVLPVEAFLSKGVRLIEKPANPFEEPGENQP